MSSAAQAGTRILLVGCGKMGGAMLDGWLARGMKPEDAVVVEPSQGAAAIARAKGIAVFARSDEVPASFMPDIVLIAVKPQSMAEAAPPLRRFAGTGATYLSIAAGKTIAGFEAALGPGTAIVRAMPNTPAAVGRGITVLCANANVTAAARETCGELLRAVGEVAWVEDEALMDPVTAVSGSGPAYVFLLIEELAAAGVAAGLKPDLAMQLARATVSGAGELARQAAESPTELRKNVTSPGGTTQAALEVLMAPDGLKPLMTRAVAAATRRSRELAG
ncbi:pyrroline-5-carboxylate reductase [Desertibaculum subflavum]|uniref:pyrroline-5-carboxylate reductase n=1 Tax=Desertibaculum subflavum TaxID=2268458 RepID=UPI000E666A83